MESMRKGRLFGMEQNMQESQSSQVIFQEMIMRAYERGVTEEGITVRTLIEELMGDLRSLLSK